MIIDAHTHIFPPSIRQNRTAALEGEPDFTGIYRDEAAVMVGASELVAAMDRTGVDRAVTFGFPWRNPDRARMHNDYILEAQGRFPDRLVGLACFNPLMDWACSEAERTLDAGLAGLGELALYGTGFSASDIQALADLGRLCHEKNRVMMVHVNEPIGHSYSGKAPLTLKMIYDLVLALNGVKLILAHWGGGLLFYNLLKREVPQALADVYFDTAASPFLYKPDIYNLAARMIDPAKILFGSDYPLIEPDRYFREMEEAGLDDEILALIKGQAAAELLRGIGLDM